MDNIWIKLLYAIPLVLLIVFLFPHARHMISNSPKPGPGDWRSVLLPIAIVVLFVLILISSMRG